MAVKKYQQAASYYLDIRLDTQQAEVLQRLGDVSCILSRYQSGIEYYKEALSRLRNAANPRLEIDLQNRIANAYLETAQAEEAQPYCHQASDQSDQIGYPQGKAEALTNYGAINSISGNVMQAEESFNQALVIWKRINYQPGYGFTLLNLGYLNGDLGDVQASLNFYQQALAVFQAINDQRRQALTLTAMGGAQMFEGERQKALNSHNDALTLFQAIGDRNGEAATLNGLGYLYDDLGKQLKALKRYEKALDLYQSLHNRNFAAITMGYIGRVQFSLKNNDKALEMYNQKLIISRTLHDRRMESYTLKDIGDVLSSLHNEESALNHYQQALALSRQVMDRRGEASILQSMGALQETSGDRIQALKSFEDAFRLMQTAMDRRGQISTLFQIARTERDLGRVTDARLHIEESLRLIEDMRTKFASPSLRVSFVETVYRQYEFYLDLLMSSDQTNPSAGSGALALEVNEHVRARTLLENLRANHVDIRQGVDSQLLDQERQLQQRLNQLAEKQMRLLSGKHTLRQADGMNDEIETLTSQFEVLESQVRANSPRYAAFTQPTQLRLPEIQKQLDDDTVLVEYALGTDRSYGWAVTRTSVSSFLLPRRSEIEAASRTLYELLETSVSVPASPASERARQAGLEANISEASRRLGAMLLDPIRSLLTRKRIAVVADGILQYIPFAAFPEGTDNVGKASGWQPLFVKHEVVMLPSWSILAVLRSESREHPPTQKTVAVLADPVFDKDDPRVRAARRGSYPPPPQSVERRGLIRRGRELLRAAQNLDGDERPVSFQRLPFSTQEAQAIFRVVPQDETMRALGFDASLKTALDPELRNYRIIHYATHGLLNNAYPELSGIVLSLVDKWGRPEDGFLRLNEIYNLDLSADLVVMSACRTGLGKDAWGEGLIGLTRGFMYAGVPRVVASLWQIDDRATAEFMRYFYEAMFVEHLVPAAALRAAQIRMWQVVEWRFPHYWAAFVLQGEWN